MVFVHDSLLLPTMVVTETAPFQWLGALATGTMATYVEQILKIKKLSAAGCRQLCTDIGRGLWADLSWLE